MTVDLKLDITANPLNSNKLPNPPPIDRRAGCAAQAHRCVRIVPQQHRHNAHGHRASAYGENPRNHGSGAGELYILSD